MTDNRNAFGHDFAAMLPHCATMTTGLNNGAEAGLMNTANVGIPGALTV